MRKLLKLFLIAFTCFSLTNPILPIHPAYAASQAIYADNLEPGWDNWSWAQVNFSSSSPVHSGSHSIGVTHQEGWTGLYLHHAGLPTGGYTHLRFFMHGGASGGQPLQVYAERANAGSGPIAAIPPPQAGAWTEVLIPLGELGANGVILTGLVWQNASNNSQPTFYVDDIQLYSQESPGSPKLEQGVLKPRALQAGDTHGANVRVQAVDPQGAGDIASVFLDGSPFGGGNIALHDDGRSNDGAANDGTFGTTFIVPNSARAGEYLLQVKARDQAGNESALGLGAFIVLQQPGGQIPPALPQRPGWGTNAWSESTGDDWQVKSGVPWDYVYQYITYEWYTDGWGGNFVGRFTHQAWNKGYIPMVTVYMMLAAPPNCGEGGSCYAEKLKNPQTVSSYLDALEEAARQARGDKPVIFNLEPDFYGFMQQLSNDAGNRPAGVRPDDPTSYPVALNISGYPNNLAGFGRRMVDLVHETAPNIIVAPMASTWATNRDPQNVPAEEAVEMGQRTADFILQMGGAEADMIIVEWSDRDAGSGIRPWWDDSDQALPRPTRAILWENALSARLDKRLMLWQVPAGNMDQNNTNQHFQDNRAAYLFQHPRDMFDAGVAAVLFGAGNGEMTQVTTDGGHIQAQGAIAYAPPAAPKGLNRGSVNGPFASLYWEENDEPDLWGYRLVYEPESGGPANSVDAGRRSSFRLLLPSAGSWRVRVQAYDAMGNHSALSAPVTITTLENARQVYLPLSVK